MNINTITLTTHGITDDLSTEESEGYTQFLQTCSIQFNNIIDQDLENFDENESQEEEEDEIPPQENPPAIIKTLPEEPP